MKWSESDLDLMKPRDTLETLHFSDNSSDLSDTVDHKLLKIRKVWSKMLNFDKIVKDEKFWKMLNFEEVLLCAYWNIFQKNCHKIFLTHSSKIFLPFQQFWGSVENIFWYSWTTQKLTNFICKNITVALDQIPAARSRKSNLNFYWHHKNQGWFRKDFHDKLHLCF